MGCSGKKTPVDLLAIVGARDGEITATEKKNAADHAKTLRFKSWLAIWRAKNHRGSAIDSNKAGQIVAAGNRSGLTATTRGARQVREAARVSLAPGTPLNWFKADKRRLVRSGSVPAGWNRIVGV